MNNSDNYHRIWVSPTPHMTSDDDEERRVAAKQIRKCIQLRDAYLYAPRIPEHLDTQLQSFQAAVRATPLAPPHPTPSSTSYSVTFGDDGIGAVASSDGGDTTFQAPFQLTEFCRDVSAVWATSAGKLTRSFAYRRLRMLDVNYEFHTLMNESYELNSTKDDKADFNTITKVDIHLHAASAFTRYVVNEPLIP